MDATFDVRGAESDIFLQQKAGDKSDGEHDQHGSNVRTERNKTKMKHLFLKKKMEGEEVKHPVESHIGHSGNPITEKLERHVFSEWRIEKINHCPDPVTDFCEDVFHEK